MSDKTLYKLLTYLVAAIWLINGLLCKVLNYVPRHQEIVGNILGDKYAGVLTATIGVSEIAMAVWIVTGRKSRINSIFQIVIIALMNILEFMLVPELLLWGRFNILFALGLIFTIYYREFILKRKLAI